MRNIMEKSAVSEKNCLTKIAALCNLCKAKVPEEENIRQKSEFFKALSDPARIKIIYALSGGDLCNCHLMDIMGMPQTAISHHMKVLKYAGIVKDRREGKQINYSLSDRNALKALGILDES
jgi:ArsR family transcriptional regulator, lead/cadmium/zinc/bismuth-responsive transcriptional repressor